MNHTQSYQEQQEAKPLAVFTAIFSLPFSGVNFSRGIVNNPELGFQKDRRGAGKSYTLLSGISATSSAQ